MLKRDEESVADRVAVKLCLSVQIIPELFGVFCNFICCGVKQFIRFSALLLFLFDPCVLVKRCLFVIVIDFPFLISSKNIL